MTDRQKIYRYFLPTLKKYRTPAFLSVFLWTIFSLTDGFIRPLFYKKLVDAASLQFTQNQFDFTILSNIFLTIGIIVAISYFVSRLASYFWTLFVNKSRYSVSFKIQLEFLHNSIYIL